MKNSLNLKVYLILISSFPLVFSLKAQSVTNENLVGCWKIKSIEFIKPMEDSLAMKNQIAGTITCFESNGRFLTKIKKGNNFDIIGTGTFKIREDGRTIDQHRDGDHNNSEDVSAEVILETNQKMLVNLKEFILKYERL